MKKKQKILKRSRCDICRKVTGKVYGCKGFYQCKRCGVLTEM